VFIEGFILLIILYFLFLILEAPDMSELTTGLPLYTMSHAPEAVAVSVFSACTLTSLPPEAEMITS
jgi:hypothetical protein